MNDIESASVAAQAYFDDMLLWERWSATAPSGGEGHAQRYKKLKSIFEKHLSKNALAHNQSRYALLDYGNPPEFSREIIKSESAGIDFVWVYVPFRSRGYARYHIKKEDEEWKVDAKETDIANKGAWKIRIEL